mgnify:CR=1 FL=1
MRGRFWQWWRRLQLPDSSAGHPDELVELALDRFSTPTPPLCTTEAWGEVEVGLSYQRDLHPDLQIVEPSIDTELADSTGSQSETSLGAFQPVQLARDLEDSLLFSPDRAQNPQHANAILGYSVGRLVSDWSSSGDEPVLGQWDDSDLLVDQDLDEEFEVVTHEGFTVEATESEALEEWFFSSDYLLSGVNDDDALLDQAFDGAAAIWEADLDLPVDRDWLNDGSDPGDEDAPEEWRLEKYAAEIVLASPVLRARDRGPLSRRVRAILEEFPFAASAAALKRIAANGATIEELEDACYLKCVWRDSSWLWLQRRYDRIQQIWKSEVTAGLKNNLTWITALRFVRGHGVSEAERLLTEEILGQWRFLEIKNQNPEERPPLWFYDYSLFLAVWERVISIHDPNSWFYDEPIDIKLLKTFSIHENDRQIWKFKMPDVRW